MKSLYLLPFLPLIAHAGFSKPQLLARFMSDGAWNAPDNMWCFSGEPVARNNRVYLNCIDIKGSLMGSWGEDGFKLETRAQHDQLLSRPVSSVAGISWYEFTEASVVRAFTATPDLTKVELDNLQTMSEMTDSFYPLTKESFFFKTKGESPKLWTWKNNQISEFFNPEAAYIFYPMVGDKGEIVVKTREKGLHESFPDKLWIYNGEWKVIFQDQDADSASPWKGFNNQAVVEGNKVLTIARDNEGEALLLIEDGKVEIIARAGKELARFDSFSPKMRAGVIVVRGQDFEGNKAVYVKDNGPFRKLLSQNDIVKTDSGDGRVYYQNRDALFYGAPGIDEYGNVYLQATLTDADFPETLLGVGLIKFKKE